MDFLTDTCVIQNCFMSTKTIMVTLMEFVYFSWEHVMYSANQLLLL